MFSEKFNGPRNFVPVRYSIHKVGPAGAKTIVCLGRWARFAHHRANVASEHKGLRAAMVVANVGALLLRAGDAITKSPAFNLISWTGSYC